MSIFTECPLLVSIVALSQNTNLIRVFSGSDSHGVTKNGWLLVGGVPFSKNCIL